jgi:hypothetical protein
VFCACQFQDCATAFVEASVNAFEGASCVPLELSPEALDRVATEAAQVPRTRTRRRVLMMVRAMLAD